ncbi:NAD(P)/FAD-dependent oxidoreductase [Blastococcus capsensis]|uniref:NAD(P)/FAD-dependent oxidoreductase n=1 Tax=Blastococcus capsensis TaxID=1564163 RepID=UPI002541525C|nr:FAD-dependent oxidoreductase [Blastococcus capsensis]MDK3258269.1 FAD-dependent oxidoreductase [Blastococcus capsensis]
MPERGTDVVVVGAGIIGAACALYAARAGLSVTVLDRGSVGAGTTSRCEGNILVSDKGAGPELDLALASRSLWLELAAEYGADRFELEEKGGLVVATGEAGMASLRRFAVGQGAAGVTAEPVTPDGLRAHEPNLASGLPGGVYYPQDLQVQPVLAAASLLAAARDLGARVVTGTEVTGAARGADGRLTAVHTRDATYPAGAVVNAAGTWGGDVGERLGGSVPVLPRRGFILVTEPLPRVIRHKVYSADYVENVASDDAGLETSAVIEGTRGGTVLIGASRERVGFDETLSVEVLRRLAAQAIRLFPFLADVRLMRSYRGFRPYCPDHLPVVGHDRRVQGLLHACGHEGAGIGLAPATGRLIADLLTGAHPLVDPGPFDPMRFAMEDV